MNMRRGRKNNQKYHLEFELRFWEEELHQDEEKVEERPEEEQQKTKNLLLLILCLKLWQIIQLK